jgi:epoxyqueuosine reductase
LGFDACRIARPDSIPQAPDQLAAFLAQGRQGDMDWLAERADWRADPQKLWPDVRSIVLLGMNYGPDSDPRQPPPASAANISVYARRRDYHEVVKGKLKQLAAFLLARAKRAGVAGDVKVFVDTAPVMEKPLAAAAGLGWQGKHTNLVSRDFGSYLFLGSIFTTLDLPADAPESDHCGNCRACLDACLTGALDAPYRIDARACVSYWTIEAKSQIPLEFREKIGNRVYGCDDCLAVCPWNKFAQVAREARLQQRADLAAPPLAALLAMDEAEFRAFFAGGPIKRLGHARFLRNLLLAAGNSGDAALAPLVAARLDHPSALARGSNRANAHTAMPRDALLSLSARAGVESDAGVQTEWARELDGDGAR